MSQQYPVYPPPPYQQPANYYGATNNNNRTQELQAFDLEAQNVVQNDKYSLAFIEKEIRMAFVRKVFILILMQLAFTIGICCIFMFVNPLKDYVRNNSWTIWVAWILIIIALLIPCCAQEILRKHPINLIFLFIFTIIFSLFLGTTTARYDTKFVIAAFIITVAIVLILLIFAIFLPVDFTNKPAIISIVFVAFLLAIIIGFFWINDALLITIAAIGAVLFSLYLIYDLQLLMGGKTRQLSPDDYTFAAFMLYTDIMFIFLYVLQIVSIANQ